MSTTQHYKSSLTSRLRWMDGRMAEAERMAKGRGYRGEGSILLTVFGVKGSKVLTLSMEENKEEKEDKKMP